MKQNTKVPFFFFLDIHVDDNVQLDLQIYGISFSIKISLKTGLAFICQYYLHSQIHGVDWVLADVPVPSWLSLNSLRVIIIEKGSGIKYWVWESNQTIPDDLAIF